ncbi:hypothetical protein HBA55_30115 [Pseudomaricurvus alkylphenolicus]|jgi:hypothetical protein|uniref:hypothetical protein n=1 Tax=Pseudomaricurvus alkylphenolicus TaxID=1306991 RepID=UPI00141F7E67|nr:hypothetical protein [Pseudomaricurvus alkylphenolicus]NIB43896.1 hypothetical protein [Pseudomaricurvus alkylphenolicus]
MSKHGLQITAEEYKAICDEVMQGVARSSSELEPMSNGYDKRSRKFFGGLNARVQRGEELTEIIEGADRLMNMAWGTESAKR